MDQRGPEQHPGLPEQVREMPRPSPRSKRGGRAEGDDVFTEASPSLDHFQRITRCDGMH